MGGFDMKRELICLSLCVFLFSCTNEQIEKRLFISMHQIWIIHPQGLMI